jgi:osmoprotectant transport system ATP-binding protein
VIELEAVTKVYSGQTAPAVQNLTMTIPDGETCVFVGPSGCGKSTTLRLINRMIGITSGTILIDGKDIHDSDPDKLRLGIGYVIQQIGLLPHGGGERRHRAAAVRMGQGENQSQG